MSTCARRAGPAITTWARRTSQTVVRSSAGSACPSEPPIVPRLRTTGSAMTCSASCTIGKSRPTTSDASRVGVPGQRADAQLVAVVGDVPQLGEVVDVDQPLGPGQPELHHRQQAVPAGDDPGLGAVAFEEFERVADAGGAHVVERSRYLHGAPPHRRAPTLGPWWRGALSPVRGRVNILITDRL